MKNKQLKAYGLLATQSLIASQAVKSSLRMPRMFHGGIYLLASLALTLFPVAVNAELATATFHAKVTDSSHLDAALGGDSDGDGIADNSDNCTNVANAVQQDSDGDGIGNACDADFDNNCIVNFIDLQIIGGTFLSDDPVTDLNSDGTVNFLDISIFISYFLMPPGPSGIAECGVNTSFEILDPTPGSSDNFGSNVIILGNGNIVVGDPFDSSIAVNNGAVHLFDPSLQTLLGSVYGDNEGDRLGLSGGLNSITVVGNNNYVVSSRFDDIGGSVDTGSVRLISGETGTQIGTALAGDNSDDGFGLSKVIALANGNYVLLVDRDDIGGTTDAGSVRLMNGATGVQIGDVLAGDTFGDFRISSSVTALANNNYVVAAPKYNVNGMVDIGSVWLMDGDTGAQIGSTLVSDNFVDNLGSVIIALPNSNYVVGSSNDAVNGLNGAGSVRLMNGNDATQIGALLAGTNPNQNLGALVTALANSNYVVSSPGAIVGGDPSVGSVQLMNGVTGAQINTPLVGQFGGDQIGFGGALALANNNYVVISPRDIEIDEDGLGARVGSVRLMNGSTGAQLGVVLGNRNGDELGSSGVTALANNNYVIRSEFDDINGLDSAGSIRLVSGTAGTQIGTALAGDDFFDHLGNIDITVLTNGNYVVPAPLDDVNGINNAGSVRLMDGATGVQIGTSLEGVTDFFNRSITALANNNYVVILPQDDVNGVVNTGSVQLMNGATGGQIGDIIPGTVNGAGISDGDLSNAFTVGSDTGDFYILAAPFWDNNSVDAGLVRLIAQ